jgi:hypothetical protein
VRSRGLRRMDDARDRAAGPSLSHSTAARSPSSERTCRRGGRRRRRPPPSTTDLSLVLADASLRLEDGGERAEKRK